VKEPKFFPLDLKKAMKFCLVIQKKKKKMKGKEREEGKKQSKIAMLYYNLL
jgi:hypothetical protein